MGQTGCRKQQDSCCNVKCSVYGTNLCCCNHSSSPCRIYNLEECNGSYTKYEYDMNILNDLLKFIRDKFHVDRYVDADGFMQVSDEPLPWED